MKPTDQYRTTRSTCDSDALAVNALLNDVHARIQAGEQLARILSGRFSGQLTPYRQWIRQNLDCSVESVGRYLALYREQDLLRQLGVIGLFDAYKLVGAAGVITATHPLWEAARP